MSLLPNFPHGRKLAFYKDSPKTLNRFKGDWVWPMAARK